MNKIGNMINIKTVTTAILFMCVLFVSQAQVSIGVKNNSKGAFYIDAKLDTDVNPANTTDDIIIANDGSLGLGTITPTKKLDVNGTSYFKGLGIADGTQNVAYVLKSDADGNASWQSSNQIAIIDIESTSSINFADATTRPLFQDANITFSKDAAHMGINKYSSAFLGSNVSFTLPEGQYQIIVDADINGTNIHPHGIVKVAYANKVKNDVAIPSTIYSYADIVLSDKLAGASNAIRIVSMGSPNIFSLTFTPMPSSFYGTSGNYGYFTQPPYTGTPKARIIVMKYNPAGTATNP